MNVKWNWRAKISSADKVVGKDTDEKGERWGKEG